MVTLLKPSKPIQGWELFDIFFITEKLKNKKEINKKWRNKNKLRVKSGEI